MGRWIKVFQDSSQEIGTDKAIRAGKASWSRGRLEGMIGAVLEDAGMSLKIIGHLPAPFWQSELCSFGFGNGQTSILKRRIERQIIPQDQFLTLMQEDGHSVTIGVHHLLPETCCPSVGYGSLAIIESNKVGQWLVAEIDPIKKDWTHYYSVGRV